MYILVSEEVRGGQQRDLLEMDLWMVVLGTEPGFSTRATSALTADSSIPPPGHLLYDCIRPTHQSLALTAQFIHCHPQNPYLLIPSLWVLRVR